MRITPEELSAIRQRNARFYEQDDESLPIAARDRRTLLGELDAVTAERDRLRAALLAISA